MQGERTLRAPRHNLELSQHFPFGENWAQFAAKLSSDHLDRACADLSRLLSVEELRGRTFLDIGCGSGLHSAAALRGGVRRLLALDIDPLSAETARHVLQRYAHGMRWQCEQRSVFDLSPAADGLFDIVYSWGVLHHTGRMMAAIDRAASLVVPGGLFVLALYSRTLFCPLWRWEKRIYSKSPSGLQWAARAIYRLAARAARALTKDADDREAIIRDRGMDPDTDLHDWLGGFPYESIRLDALEQHMQANGFDTLRRFPYGGRVGLFGSGCFEVVLRHTGPS